jgi:hypothetical protein
MPRLAGYRQNGPSHCLVKIDVEVFTRPTLLQGCLECLAKKQLNARSIQSSVRTAWLNGNCHPAVLGFGS